MGDFPKFNHIMHIDTSRLVLMAENKINGLAVNQNGIMLLKLNTSDTPMFKLHFILNNTLLYRDTSVAIQ